MTRMSNRRRDCRDEQRIEHFLTEQHIGLLGLRGDEHPYVVPVNYVWHDGAVVFHGAGSGKKLRLIVEDPAATFVVFRHDGTIPDPVPCHSGTAFFSVMLFGQVERITDHAAAAEALQHLLDALAPGQHRRSMSAGLVEHYRSNLDDNPMAVFRLTPEHITAKENVTPAGS